LPTGRCQYGIVGKPEKPGIPLTQPTALERILGRNRVLQVREGDTASANLKIRLDAAADPIKKAGWT
jgi:hypothetical protein